MPAGSRPGRHLLVTLRRSSADLQAALTGGRCGARMRVNRLAIIALAAGSVLLGSSAAGVTAIGGNLPASAAVTAQQEHGHGHDHDHGSERGL